MTSTKKLSISAAILATGFGLALLFASPRSVYVPPSVVPSDHSLDNYQSSLHLLAGPSGIDSTQLLPDVPPQKEETITKVEAPTPEPVAAAPPPEPAPVQARLVGILPSAEAPPAEDGPRTPVLSLPQVSVQVASVKPVYATVEYPEIVSANPAGTSAWQPQTGLLQASFDAPTNSRIDTPPDALVDRAVASETPTTRTHIIIDGDSLTKLAERYLDDPQRGEDIFQFNKGVLTDPELLPIGVELKIPPRSLRAQPLAGWNGQSDGTALEPGLVPVDEIPVVSATPRAQLLKPMPASWPERQ